MSAVREAIRAVLAGDAPLTQAISSADAIYHRVAPANTSPVYITFSKQSGVPIWSMADHMDRELWLVKAVGRESAAAAEHVAELIDSVLTDAELNIAGRATLYLRRESDVDYGETDGGNQWHHVGGVYRLVTQP